LGSVTDHQQMTSNPPPQKKDLIACLEQTSSIDMTAEEKVEVSLKHDSKRTNPGHVH